jgi:hypothetical protein
VAIPATGTSTSPGTSATGWTCTSTANDPSNIAAFALCCTQ